MSHEDRQLLIRAPITFHIAPYRSWGGVAVLDSADFNEIRTMVHTTSTDAGTKNRLTWADRYALCGGDPFLD